MTTEHSNPLGQFFDVVRNGPMLARKTAEEMIEEDPQLVHYRDNYNQESDVTALHVAAWYLRWSVVECLLAHGAAVDARDSTARTPLHYAAGTGGHSTRDELSVLSKLLDAGADPNARTNAGETALHYASGAGSDAAMRVLLEAGADPRIKDARGKTPSQSWRWGEHVILPVVQMHAKPQYLPRWWEFWKK